MPSPCWFLQLRGTCLFTAVGSMSETFHSGKYWTTSFARFFQSVKRGASAASRHRVSHCWMTSYFLLRVLMSGMWFPIRRPSLTSWGRSFHCLKTAEPSFIGIPPADCTNVARVSSNAFCSVCKCSHSHRKWTIVSVCSES
jgi:hypothetical protein